MNHKDKKRLDINRVMRTLVTFESKIESEGQDILDDYKECKNVYGELNHYRSRLINQAKSENTREYIVVIIRYRKDIDETMRMDIDNKKYQIESIRPLNFENLYVEITGYLYKNDMIGSDFS